MSPPRNDYYPHSNWRLYHKDRRACTQVNQLFLLPWHVWPSNKAAEELQDSKTNIKDMEQHLGHNNTTLKSSTIRATTLCLNSVSVKKYNKLQANGRLSASRGQLPSEQYNVIGTWVRGWKTTAVHSRPLKSDNSREFCDEEHAIQQPQPLSRPANIAISQQNWCKWQQALA